MSHRSILHRRARRRITKDFELPLTSMLDMLVILLVFMLKSYSTSAVAFATSNNIQLPTSNIPDAHVEGVNLIIEPTALILDGDRVLEFADAPKPQTPPNGSVPVKIDFKPEQAQYKIEAQLLADGDRRILPLYDSLIKARDKYELIRKSAPEKRDEKGNLIARPPFNGTLIVHADKTVKYDVLRKVMYTAGAAEFRVFKLVAMKKEQ